jgi:AcrR family transcriptional regulator
MVVTMKTRTYQMQARAEAAEARTEAILQSAVDLFAERPFDKIALSNVADRAGVGLQTLIRRFPTKDALARAAIEWNFSRIAGVRGDTGPDPGAAAGALMEHYERWGALTDRMLRQEDVSPALAEAAARGRADHREWVERTFSGQLPDRLARLTAICGVELWLVLRRDLSATAARDAVADLIAATLDREA